MTFLVVFELYPLSIKFCGTERASLSVFIGMALCFASLVLLRRFEIAEMSN